MATAYPFDPSGTSAANRIVNEQHVITAVNFRDYHYVIPKFAPFFAESMVLRMQYPNGNIRTLTQGLDYYFSHQFLDASRACAKPVYGSISFLDTDEAGVLSITYQSVGGIWTLSASEISRILAEQMRNPRITSWEQITYLPERFPIIDHEWDLIDMVGASEVVRALDEITTTILNVNGGGLTQHTSNYSNPHNVTKTQVGLGNVQNYGIANQSQAEAGNSTTLYMTPLTTKQAIAQFGQEIVDVHTRRTDNPHGVTKTQVGLGNVQNYSMATTAEATAGLATDRFLSPKTVADAIAFQVGDSYFAHAANHNNPHDVTKAQVGLVFVENYPVASAEEARAGTRADRYMTPQRTTQLMAEYVNIRMMEHELRTDNPHEVNKIQVGLGNVQNYPMATQAQVDPANSTTHYVNPAIAAQIAQAQIAVYMDSVENPGGVTKAMVGLSNVENYGIASKLQAEAGTSNQAYMTPLRTKEAIDAIAVAALDAHSTRQDNPHNVTAEQIGALSLSTMTNELSNYVKRTDSWVSGQPRLDFIEEVRNGTVANTVLFDGHDSENYMNFAATSLYNSMYAKNWVYPATINSANTATTARGAIWDIASINLNAYQHDESGNGTANTQEAVFMVTGGQHWNTSVSNGAGFAEGAPVWLVRIGRGAFPGGAPTLNVTMLSGHESAARNYIEFGWRNVDGDLRLVMATTANHRSFNVVAMVPYGYSFLENKHNTTTGVTFITAIKGSDNALRLNGQAASYYATATSVTTTNQALDALALRVTALEQLLGSITVV